MTEPVVSIQSITKQYKGSVQPAIDNLSLDIPGGSVFGLLGPNGAGKSTLVMMLCGLMNPDAGSIQMFGINTRKDGPAIRKRVGVATQEIALFPSLTASENLEYFGKMYGLNSDIVKSKTREYLDIFGLSEKSHKRVQTFSGGMKRRLNLIAALLHNPAVLILDEPTAGVDVQSRNIVLEFLMGFKSPQNTIIYTSHFLDEAERICTQLAIIDEGKMIAKGTPSEMINGQTDCKSLEDLFLKLTGKHIRD